MFDGDCAWPPREIITTIISYAARVQGDPYSLPEVHKYVVTADDRPRIIGHPVCCNGLKKVSFDFLCMYV